MCFTFNFTLCPELDEIFSKISEASDALKTQPPSLAPKRIPLKRWKVFFVMCIVSDPSLRLSPVSACGCHSGRGCQQAPHCDTDCPRCPRVPQPSPILPFSHCDSLAPGPMHQCIERRDPEDEQPDSHLETLSCRTGGGHSGALSRGVH